MTWIRKSDLTGPQGVQGPQGLRGEVTIKDLAGGNIPIVLIDNGPEAAFSVDTKTVALYHLENSGADATANGYDASTYSVTPTYSAASARFGTAGQSGGINRIPDAADAFVPIGTPMPDMTIEAWVKTTATGSVMVAVGRASAYFIAMDASGYAWAGLTNQSGGTINITSTVKINDGAWHFLSLIIRNGFGATLYVDRVQAASTAGIGQRASNSNSQLTIGAMGAGFIWNGSIDEVRLSNVARSPLKTYPGRPIGMIPGAVTYVGSSTPTDALKGDVWRKVSA